MNKIQTLFFKGDKRTVTAKINIFFSFLLQGVSILISLLLVPLTLNYLSAEEYGVWLTLSSILTWITVCDIGLGNGLRNKLGEALAQGNYKLGQIYVSVTVTLLTMIMGGVFLLFIIINPFLNWNRILNIHTIDSILLSKTVFIVVSFFCVQFVLKFIGIILLADQKAAWNSLIGVISSLLALIVIYILILTVPASLLYISIAFSASPVLVLIISYPFFFRRKYKSIKPQLSAIDFSYGRELLGLSLKFFILQISSIVVFSTSNMVISQVLGPEDVTIYNICFKYFSLITMAFNIVLSPMWAAYTNAYVLNDLDWIKRSTKKMIMIWTVLSLSALLMVIVSNNVYRFWVGDSVKIPVRLSALMMIYVCISNWNNIFAQFLAGIGKVKLSLINSMFNTVIFIPISLYLTKQIAVDGILLAMILTLLTSTFWQPIQCYKILKGKARGLWNK